MTNRIIAAFVLFWICLLGVSAAHAQETFALTGRVIQGTVDGSPLAEGYALQLLILGEDGGLIETRHSQSRPDGTFIFDGVPSNPAFFYAVTTQWAGIEQSSIPLKKEEISAAGGVEFALFDVTDSLDNVVVSGGNLRVEFPPTGQLGVQILLELTYVNLGNRLIYSPAGALAIELPVGAFGTAMEETSSGTGRFTVVDSLIPAIVDMQPLVPDVPYILRASFFVPYADGAVLDIRFPVAMNDLSIFIRDDRVELQSNLHTPADTQSTSSGNVYRVYDQTTPLLPGEPFKFTLLGNITPPPTLASQPTSSSGTVLVALILGAVLVFSGLMAWFVLARRTEADKGTG